MGLQAAVHLGHMPWALTKEEEDHCYKQNIYIYIINSKMLKTTL
jgi:hypothetical protein